MSNDREVDILRRELTVTVAKTPPSTLYTTMLEVTHRLAEHFCGICSVVVLRVSAIRILLASMLEECVN